jgi:hypothetical protein
MQANLRFFLYAVFGVLAIWFLIMVIDTQVFLHTNADDIVSGTVPMNRTDIGDRCGAEYDKSVSLVDYKLTPEGQIIYQCPLGLSPIRRKVTAIMITDAFRQFLRPAQLTGSSNCPRCWCRCSNTNNNPRRSRRNCDASTSSSAHATTRYEQRTAAS